MSHAFGDPGKMDELAAKCDRAADEVEAVVRKLDSATAPSSDWQGPSATSFRQIVNGHIQTARSAKANVRSAASSLRRDAARARALIAEMQRKAAQKRN